MSSEGVSDKRLPWLIRLLVEMALDGVNHEEGGLEDIGAPKIDAFIEYDNILAPVFKSKKVRSSARYFKHGYDEKRYVHNTYTVEYEFAYLKKRLPIRTRLEKKDLAKMFVDLSSEGNG